MTEKFHDYVYGSSFEVITDNNRLTYNFTTAKLDATGQRWVASLSHYNFTIKYRSGKKNADADGLSRRNEGNTGICTVFPDMIKAVSMTLNAAECPFIDSVYVSESSDSIPPFTEDITIASDTWPDCEGLERSSATRPILKFCYKVSKSRFTCSIKA